MTTTSSGVPAPIAGWYRDPLDPNVDRFWDGVTWTNAARVIPPPRAGVPASPVAEPTGPVVPTPWWWLPIAVAAATVISVFAPTATYWGEVGYSFHDDFGRYDWAAMWPSLAGAAMVAVAGLCARAGRSVWLSVSAGVVAVVSALNIAAVAFVLEMFVGFQSDGFEVDVTPHVGLIASLGATVGGVVLAVIAVRQGLRSTRATLPVPLRFVLAACAGWVLYVLARAYFADGTPLWNGDYLWLNAVTLAVFAPLVVLVVLPLVAANGDAAGFAGGFACPLAVIFIAAVVSEGTGAIGVTDASGAGLAIFAMCAVGLGSGLLYGRVLRRGSSGGTVDVADPQKPLAILVVGFALVVALGVVASQGSESSFGFGGGSARQSGFVFGGEVESHFFSPSSTGLHTIRVEGLDGFDPLMSVFVNGGYVDTVDDSFGSSDPSLELYLYSGDDVEVVVEGWDFTAGGYEVVFTG